MLLSEDRLSQLCHEYYSDVFRFAVHFLRDSERAKDVTQDTFLLLSQKADVLYDDNIKGWLFSTAYRKIKNTQKSVYNEAMQNKGDEYTIDSVSGDTVEDSFIRENILSLSLEAINSLSESDRKLYLMRYNSNLSYSEIAERLEQTENTVYVRIHRLREKIISYIRENITI